MTRLSPWPSMIVVAEAAPVMFTVWPETSPGWSSPLSSLYLPAGSTMFTVPPMLLARQVASRRLSGDGTVVDALPQAPPLAAMSAVVETVSVVAAVAGAAATAAATRAATAMSRTRVRSGRKIGHRARPAWTSSVSGHAMTLPVGLGKRLEFSRGTLVSNRCGQTVERRDGRDDQADRRDALPRLRQHRHLGRAGDPAPARVRRARHARGGRRGGGGALGPPCGGRPGRRRPAPPRARPPGGGGPRGAAGGG